MARWKGVIWQQFGAAIDMLERAIVECPEQIWSDETPRPQVWYIAFHTLFFLDYYLSPTGEAFKPPRPFGLTEMDPSGVMPERPYTKAELLRYLRRSRSKCRALIDGLTHHQLWARRRFVSIEAPLAELLLYNMRHVQHHTAQLYLILRQRIDSAPQWIGRARRSQARPRRTSRATRASRVAAARTSARVPAGRALRRRRRRPS